MVDTRTTELLKDLPTKWVARPATMDDIDGIIDMMNARSQVLYGEDQVTRPDIEVWWKSLRFDPEKDLLVVLDANVDVAGIANVGNPGEPYAQIGCAAVLHPSYAGHGGLWDELNAWALRRAEEFVPLAPMEIRVAALSSIAAQDEARRAGLERAGFKAVRIANHMRIELALPIPAPCWPGTVRMRTVNLEQDLRAIVSLYLEAWRDHWGFVEQPFERALSDWREGVESEGDRFDPSLWFLAVDGEDLVGMCLCNSHIAGDATRGYVQGLGVRPAWRKRGIALALLHHSFAEFQRRGYAAVELDMDSENLTGALRVYERAGMRAIRESVFFEKELRAGIDLATRKLPM